MSAASASNSMSAIVSWDVLVTVNAGPKTLGATTGFIPE
jgi:hypothetical protein